MIERLSDVSPQFLGELRSWLQKEFPSLSVKSPRQMTGTFNSSGTVLRGSGFTVTKVGTGNFQVTFTGTWTTAPVLVADVEDNATSLSHKVANVGTSTAQILTFTSSTGTLADPTQGIHFIAIAAT